MTVNGHWQYKLTIPVHVFCVNQDNLRKYFLIYGKMWQNGFKLMAQAIMQQGIFLNFSNKKDMNERTYGSFST